MTSSVLLYVIVIAHPDDESMFFVPTLQNLKSSNTLPTSSTTTTTSLTTTTTTTTAGSPNAVVWLVCLTNGNYNGLGKTREEELERVVTHLFQHQIDQLLWLTTRSNNDVCVDHPRQSWDIPKAGKLLQDTLEHAMNQYIWNASSNSSTICKEPMPDSHVTMERISFITFDEYGVSGHVNHRDTHRTVQWMLFNWKPQQPMPPMQFQQHQLFQQLPPSSTSMSIIPVEAWQLQSEQNLVIKYFPMLFWVQLLLVSLHQLWDWLTMMNGSSRQSTPHTTSSNRRHYCSSMTQRSPIKWTMTSLQPLLNYAAMASHASQFVWYRQLFVVFSCYTYRNVLLPLDPSLPTTTAAATGAAPAVDTNDMNMSKNKKSA